ncbi:MAG TPA: NUDIX hydrolase [Candidatus Saccharimonadales bacterium]|nr:NUDIX hydrolase [Candidatus Saccharimonadales bacterium]
MVSIAVIFLRLPDGRFIFQRRGKTAPTSPGLLGLFGGHIEEMESADEAVRRELSEETSLQADKISIQKLADKLIQYDDGQERHFFYYLADIENPGFKVYEGEGKEVYSLKAALKRSDLTISTRSGLRDCR